jgi:c-di-GMP-related signal transduction protein
MSGDKTSPLKSILARQPIIDRGGKVQAYELLFRDLNDFNHARVSSDVMATSTVLINTMSHLGAHNVLGPYPGFININEELIDMGVLESLEPKKFVLEILETSTINDQTLAKLTTLKEAGYTLALDDFDFSRDMFEQFKDIFSIISILKVDLIECDWEALPQMITQAKSLGVQLLAEKVETREQHEKCMKMGFDLFQGYYFARPQIIEGRKISSATLSVIRLIDLMSQNCETQVIVEEFKRHPAITISLLRYMNSASHSIGKQIQSIQQAVTLIGRRKLSRWLMLMIYAEGDKGQEPSENPIYQLASQRAKVMENITQFKFSANQDLLDKAFLCGVLSLMDSLLGVSLKEIIHEFNLDKEIQLALLEEAGPLGKFIKICRAQDRTQKEPMEDLAKAADLNLDNISDAYLQAYHWMATH